MQQHLGGLENALRHLGMLPGGPKPPRVDMRSVGRFVWLRCEDEGWWEADVHAGDVVNAGASLGTVRNLFGDVTEEIAAPEGGVVLFITTSPAVEAGGLLVGLGVEIGEV